MYVETSEDSQRKRAGLFILLIGVFLLFWVWMMIMLGSPKTPTSANGLPAESRDVDEQSPLPDTRLARLRSIPKVLIVGSVLVLVFIVGSYVFVRGSRRFAASLNEGPSTPTQTSDVWSMHVLPGERPRRRDPGD